MIDPWLRQRTGRQSHMALYVGSGWMTETVTRSVAYNYYSMIGDKPKVATQRVGDFDGGPLSSCWNSMMATRMKYMAARHRAQSAEKTNADALVTGWRKWLAVSSSRPAGLASTSQLFQAAVVTALSRPMPRRCPRPMH